MTLHCNTFYRNLYIKLWKIHSSLVSIRYLTGYELIEKYCQLNSVFALENISSDQWRIRCSTR